MVVGVVVALLMVGAMEGLQEMHLTLWLHIPLTAIVLTLMAGGAGLAGVAFLEWRERLAGKRVG
jgi:type III secretory pathway component EscS